MLRKLGQDVEEDERVPFAAGEDLRECKGQIELGRERNVATCRFPEFELFWYGVLDLPPLHHLAHSNLGLVENMVRPRFERSQPGEHDRRQRGRLLARLDASGIPGPVPHLFVQLGKDELIDHIVEDETRQDGTPDFDQVNGGLWVVDVPVVTEAKVS